MDCALFLSLRSLAFLLLQLFYSHSHSSYLLLFFLSFCILLFPRVLHFSAMDALGLLLPFEFDAMLECEDGRRNLQRARQHQLGKMLENGHQQIANSPRPCFGVRLLLLSRSCCSWIQLTTACVLVLLCCAYALVALPQQ